MRGSCLVSRFAMTSPPFDRAPTVFVVHHGVGPWDRGRMETINQILRGDQYRIRQQCICDPGVLAQLAKLPLPFSERVHIDAGMNPGTKQL